VTGILLIGGTGTVGGATADALAAMGRSFTVAARRPPPGGVAIDLRQPETLAAARGFRAALLVTPIGPEETEVGLAAVGALREAGVDRIVFLSIQNLEAMQAIPHFAAKIPIKEAVLADGRSTVLEANFFQSNDRMLLGGICAAGVYGLPVGGTGVFSVAPADLGAGAANALTDDRWAGRALPLCGPERLTGDGLAANWTDRLGRPVRYAGDDPAPFLAGIGQHLPPEASAFRDWLLHDMRTMMEVTQAMGCLATDADIAICTELVGRPLIRHRTYIDSLGERP
jgi:uncharacterized protein YbjT (DUF2867 family)